MNLGACGGGSRALGRRPADRLTAPRAASPGFLLASYSPSGVLKTATQRLGAEKGAVLRGEEVPAAQRPTRPAPCYTLRRSAQPPSETRAGAAQRLAGLRSPCALTRPRPRKQCSRRRPAPGLPVGGLKLMAGARAPAAAGSPLQVSVGWGGLDRPAQRSCPMGRRWPSRQAHT